MTAGSSYCGGPAWDEGGFGLRLIVRLDPVEPKTEPRLNEPVGVCVSPKRSGQPRSHELFT